MKASVIVGSGSGGFTDRQCTALAEALGRSGWECAVHRPAEMDIGDCTGCLRCAGEGRCVMDDDMSLIIRDFLDSDAVIMGSPVRFSSLSSIAKKVMDRFQPLWNTDALKNRRRRLALLMNGGSEHPRTDHAEGCVRAFCISMNCEYVGCWLMSGTDDRGFSDQEMDSISAGIVSALSR